MLLCSVQYNLFQLAFFCDCREKRRVSLIVSRDCIICYNGLMWVPQNYKRGGDFFSSKLYMVHLFRIWCYVPTICVLTLHLRMSGTL